MKGVSLPCLCTWLDKFDHSFALFYSSMLDSAFPGFLSPSSQSTPFWSLSVFEQNINDDQFNCLSMASNLIEVNKAKEIFTIFIVLFSYVSLF
jgi:hypothetical protein